MWECFSPGESCLVNMKRGCMHFNEAGLEALAPVERPHLTTVARCSLVSQNKGKYTCLRRLPFLGYMLSHYQMQTDNTGLYCTYHLSEAWGWYSRKGHDWSMIFLYNITWPCPWSTGPCFFQSGEAISPDPALLEKKKLYIRDENLFLRQDLIFKAGLQFTI